MTMLLGVHADLDPDRAVGGGVFDHLFDQSSHVFERSKNSPGREVELLEGGEGPERPTRSGHRHATSVRQFPEGGEPHGSLEMDVEVCLWQSEQRAASRRRGHGWLQGARKWFSFVASWGLLALPIRSAHDAPTLSRGRDGLPTEGSNPLGSGRSE